MFYEDRYLSLLQGVVNLIISIALVGRIGLTGIYIGTVVSGLIANITKPVIIYRACFGAPGAHGEKDDEDWQGAGVGSYFKASARFLSVTVVACVISMALRRLIMPVPQIPGFLLMMVLITVVFNGLFLIVFGRSREFNYLRGRLPQLFFSSQ